MTTRLHEYEVFNNVCSLQNCHDQRLERNLYLFRVFCMYGKNIAFTLN